MLLINFGTKKKTMKLPLILTSFLIAALATAEIEIEQSDLTVRNEEITTLSPFPCGSAEEIEDSSEYQTENGIKQPPLNKNFQCGVRPHVRMRRIVGGMHSTFGAWPWQVLIRELTSNCSATQYRYGGVLISEDYVLTVAHWKPEPNGSLVAVFGEFDISEDSEPKSSVTIRVKQIIYHPEFNNRTFDNDLALLKLEKPIQYDTHIVPICMPSYGADFTGRIAMVSGWGRLSNFGRFPNVLQEVDVPIIENSECQEMIAKHGYTKMILPSTLCAGYEEGGRDSCEGDSGGPLVLLRLDGRWELAGTVSNGIKCAARSLPGLYMRTSYFRLWIESITGVLSEDNEINT